MNSELVEKLTLINPVLSVYFLEIFENSENMTESEIVNLFKNWMLGNWQLETFASLAESANDRQLTRLWNFADHQTDCEEFFAVLMIARPDRFENPENANTFKFVY